MIRKVAIGFFMVVLALAFVTPVYSADCGSAKITRVGVNPTNSYGASDYFVQLDCSDNSKWPGVVSFYLSKDLGDPGLATLLSAYSLGKTVWVRTLGVSAGSIISVMYIND